MCIMFLLISQKVEKKNQNDHNIHVEDRAPKCNYGNISRTRTSKIKDFLSKGHSWHVTIYRPKNRHF